jgi:hypothetical protein
MLKSRRNQNRILLLQSLGFAVLILLTWVDIDVVFPWIFSSLTPHQTGLLTALTESMWICALDAYIFAIQVRSAKRIKHLEGLLSVCSFCKRIRKEGRWIPIEEYIRDHSEADFSHGFCPECGVKNYGDLYLRSQENPAQVVGNLSARDSAND